MRPQMPPRRPFALLTLVALTAAAPLACDDPLDESPVVARYVLTSVDGSALPAPSFPGLQVEIVADTIYLREDGTGVQRSHRRELIGGGMLRMNTRLTWTVAGSRLRLVYRCDDTVLADCIAPPHLTGAIQGATLAVDTAVAFPVPATYTSVTVM